MDETKPQILVVDDSDAGRLITTRALTTAGFAVVEARTGTEGLHEAQKQPDLIILDIDLPDINGIEVCRRIKADPAASSIPILLLTAAFVETEDKIRGLESGADNFLTLPIDPLELVCNIKALLRMKAAELEARAELSKWHTTFNAIADAICLLDVEGRIVRFNTAFARQVQKPAEQITGRFCWDITHGSAGMPPHCPTYKARQTRQRELRLAKIDDRHYVDSVDPVLDASGEIVNFVHILRDISAQESTERDLAQKSADLDAFTYSLSHDLRAPLRGIDGFTRRLIEEYAANMPDEAQAMLGRVINATQRMGRLIDSLIVFSNIDSKPLTLSHIDMNDMVRQLAAKLTDGPPAREIEFRISNLPAAEGDRKLLRLAWTKLIENAAKYTGGRTPPVIEIGSQIGADGRTNYFIRDNGIGFDMRHADKLFNIFERLHSIDDYEGTGVGLAIVKRIIERHSGTIQAEGQIDNGACFSFSLSVK